MMAPVHVKVCGVCSVEDARTCVESGVSAIGLNFVASSKRRIDVATARTISDFVHAANAKIQIVGVVADRGEDDLRALVEGAGLDCLQLHGDETPELVARFLPHAYKAVRVAGEADIARARAFPGEHVLVDAYVAGALGGTGAVFDWSLARDLARTRKLTLAGGLTPANVAEAIRVVMPYCVDVASGVESRGPGIKDPDLVREFVRAARG